MPRLVHHDLLNDLTNLLAWVTGHVLAPTRAFRTMGCCLVTTRIFVDDCLAHDVDLTIGDRCERMCLLVLVFVCFD